MNDETQLEATQKNTKTGLKNRPLPSKKPATPQKSETPTGWLETHGTCLQRSMPASTTSPCVHALLIDNLPVAQLTISPDGQIREANTAAASLLKTDRRQLTNKEISHFIDASDLDRWKNFVHYFTEHNTTQDIELMLQRSDGTVFQARIYSTRCLDTLGHPELCVTITDNSDFRSLLSATLDGYFMADRHGRFLDVNDHYCVQSGYTRAELLTMKIRDVEASESSAEVATHLHKVSRDGHDLFETRQRRKDGSLWHVEISATHVKKQDGLFYGFARDISKRKAEEQQRSKNLETLTTVLDEMDAIVYVADMEDFKIIFANRYLRETIASENLIGATCWQIFQCGKEGPCIACANAVMQMKAGTDVPENHQWEFKNPRNKHWYAFNNRIITWPDGRLVRLATGVDITQRALAEKSLRLTRLGVDATSDSLFWVTSNAHIVDANAAACRALGYCREELLQLSIPNIDGNYTADIWPQHFAELKQRRVMTIQSEHRKKNGQIFPVEITATYFRDGKHEYQLTVARDITERRQSGRTLLLERARLRALMNSMIAWSPSRTAMIVTRCATPRLPLSSKPPLKTSSG